MKAVFSVLFLFALLEQFNASPTYKIFTGHPNELYQVGYQLWLESGRKCLSEALTTFADKGSNAAAFCETTKECRAYAIPELIRNCLKEHHTSIFSEKYPCWKTYMVFEKKDWRLVIYWTLDRDSQGKNFGSAGSELDLPTDNKCDYDPSGEGPGPFNTTWFCSSPKRHSLISIPKYDDEFLFDFSQEFQISLWIKTNPNCASRQLLIGSERVTSTRFLLYPSTNCDQLTFALSDITNEYVVSTVDDTGIRHWRHLTLIFKPPNFFKFLRYGREWPMKQKPKNGSFTFVEVNKIAIFATVENKMPFTGHLGGISFMQKS